MHNIYKLLLLTGIFSAKLSYGDSWAQKNSFPGIGRSQPFFFTIGNCGYIGGGKDTMQNGLQDFWEYDAVTDSWSQKANFGGGYIAFGIGFSVAGKGYAGFGLNTSTAYDDIWEYDPLLNSWVKKWYGFGTTYLNSTAFSIGNKGYICTGIDYLGNHSADLLSYSVPNNNWPLCPPLPADPRNQASSFSIGNNGYVGLGGGANPVILDDFWKYNSLTNAWTQIADYPDTGRFGGIGFSIGDKGYAGFGFSNPGVQYMFSIWQYDTTLNLWTKKTNCPGAGRVFPVAFVINNKAYIGLGGNSATPFTDLWEYTPDPLAVADTEERLPEYDLYPNPATAYIYISREKETMEDVFINIYNMSGSCLASIKEKGTELTLQLDVSALSPGNYIVKMQTGNKQAGKRLVKI